MADLTFWQRFAFDAAWQSTVLGMVAWILLASVVRRPAARSWTALLAAGLCIVVPLSSLIVRSSGFGLLSPTSTTASAAVSRVDIAEDEAGAGNSRPPVDTRFRPRRTEGADALPTRRTTVSLPATTAAKVTVAEKQLDSNSSLGLFPFILLLWATASFVVGLRLLASGSKLWQLCGEAETCSDAAIRRAAAEAAGKIGLKGEPQVKSSRLVNLPGVVTFWYPLLLIPHDATHRSGTHWLSIFCHELAHVRRRDGWALLSLELVCTLLPWQPLLWMLRRAYQRAAEEACDDWAVSTGSDPLDFAESLAAWNPSRAPRLVFGVLGSRSESKRRIERLVKMDFVPSPRLGLLRISGSAALATCVALPIAFLQVRQPALIGDDETSSPVLAQGVSAATERDEATQVVTAFQVDSPPKPRNAAQTIGDQSFPPELSELAAAIEEQTRKWRGAMTLAGIKSTEAYHEASAGPQLPVRVFGPELLKVAREAPSLAVSFVAACYLLGHGGGSAPGDELHELLIEGMKVVLRRHKDNPHVSSFLAPHTLNTVRTIDVGVETFYRDLLNLSENDTVRAAAADRLARHLDSLAFQKLRLDKTIQRLRDASLPARSIALFTSLKKDLKDREPLELREEAKQLARYVRDNYPNERPSVLKTDGWGLLDYEFFRDPNQEAYGSLADRFLFELENLREGCQAPEIEGRDANGETFRLSDYRGQVVLLMFSFNGCGPCAAWYPLNRSLLQQYKDQPFAVLTVMCSQVEGETVDSLRETMDKGDITWRCWWDDHDAPITEQWQVWGWPDVYLIDAEGKIRVQTPYRFDPGSLQQTIGALIEETK